MWAKVSVIAVVASSVFALPAGAAPATGDARRAVRVSAQNAVKSAGDWDQVAAGDYHSCATRVDGSLWCWGYNGFGELGDGTLDNRKTPTRVGC